MFVTPGYAQEHAPAEGEVHAGEEAHQPEGGLFPPFDASTFPSQLLWLAISFGLFYLFLKRVAMPRIGGVLEVRQARIAGDLDQAARMKAEADAAVAAYEQELAEARSRAGLIGQQARDRAKTQAEADRKEVTAQLDSRLAESEARIAGIKATAMLEVGTIAEETAAAIVQHLSGSAVEPGRVAAAVRAAGE